MSGKLKVMIVDDASYFRFALKKYFRQDPSIEIVGAAKNGIDALEQLKTVTPDVITLDIEMPGMNGIEFLKYIMSTNPIPVIMLSSLTPEATDITIKSLQYGAVDFINKKSINLSLETEKVSRLLLNKVRIAAKANIKKIDFTDIKKAARKAEPPPGVSFKITKAQVIAIGASTGGPRALQQLIPLLPSNLPAGIIIVQHMPAVFTASLAKRLNEASKIVVKEAEDGDLVLPGRALVAPGGFHTEITKNFTVKLTKKKPVNHVRPSVDVLYDSLVDVYGENITAVILTGMGFDGASGAEKIKKKGGTVIAEAESTCTIYGMPKAIVQKKLADKVLPLYQIHRELIKSLG